MGVLWNGRDRVDISQVVKRLNPLEKLNGALNVSRSSKKPRRIAAPGLSKRIIAPEFTWLQLRTFRGRDPS